MLNIKLINIDSKTINSTLFEIIYKGNYYKINLENIELILTKKLNVDIDIVQTKNYTMISQFAELVNYINTEIKTYISEVFLKYSNNEMEEIYYINELLNNKELDIDLKKKIILKEQNINDKSFTHIVKLASTKYIFNEFDFSNISKSRSKEILSNEKICIKFNKNNYQNIKENHEELLITFIENNIKEFCNSISELEYDSNLIIKIITSNNIERNYKIIILSKCDESLEITELIQKETIIDFILKGRKSIDISYNLFNNFITYKLNINKLIDLVIFQSANLDNEQLTECLLQFPIPYSNVARLNKVPKLLINDQNNKLKQFLEERKLEYISSITKTTDNKYYKINKKHNK